MKFYNTRKNFLKFRYKKIVFKIELIMKIKIYCLNALKPIKTIV